MEGQRKALIVASGEYEHEGLRRLLSPAVDAAALAEVLENPHIGGFDVQIVHNEPAHDIQAQIEDLFSDARPDDVLLVHFSCHGLKNEAGELFFAARNTRPSRLASTAISADFVQRCVRASRSRSIVLLLDCCYGAAFGQGVTVRASGDVNVLDSFPTGKLGGGRGRAVITASNAMEYAFEGERLADDHSAEPSLFTAALVRGLSTGEADRDEDGWVSLNELYEYVFDRVRASPHQTPSRDIEMQGELYVARSRRRRIRPVAVPADLMAATTDPSMYSRVGAIAELRSRLLSDNLPVAIGAHEALTAMAATDIDYVAEKAVTALREADVHVSERELHFGEVAQGASSPHRRLHLAGPPIARVGMVVDASDPWIRIEEGAGWVDAGSTHAAWAGCPAESRSRARSARYSSPWMSTWSPADPRTPNSRLRPLRWVNPGRRDRPPRHPILPRRVPVRPQAQVTWTVRRRSAQHHPLLRPRPARNPTGTRGGAKIRSERSVRIPSRREKHRRIQAHRLLAATSIPPPRHGRRQDGSAPRGGLRR